MDKRITDFLICNLRYSIVIRMPPIFRIDVYDWKLFHITILAYYYYYYHPHLLDFFFLKRHLLSNVTRAR